MWVTVYEAARKIGVGANVVFDLVRNQRVPFSTKGDMCTKVRVREVERALARDAERILRGDPEPSSTMGVLLRRTRALRALQHSRVRHTDGGQGSR